MADIRAVIRNLQPELQAAFLDAVNDIRSTAQLSVITRALEEGRVEDALTAMRLSEQFFAPLDDALRAAYLEGGRDALVGLPAIADPFQLATWWSALTHEIRGPSNGCGTDQEP